MTILEAAQRQAAMAEAESWIGTPFHHQGRVKGKRGGVDCAMLLLEVFLATEVVQAEPQARALSYSMQWHLHREEERYLKMIEIMGGRPVDTPQPGDVAVWKMGRAYSHGAIALRWPDIIHAAAAPINACVRDSALMSALNLGKYPVRFFTAWPAEKKVISNQWSVASEQ